MSRAKSTQAPPFNPRAFEVFRERFEALVSRVARVEVLAIMVQNLDSAGGEDRKRRCQWAIDLLADEVGTLFAEMQQADRLAGPVRLLAIGRLDEALAYEVSP